MNVLFIVPYPTQGPSNRFRVEQYFPYLKHNNIDYSISSLQSETLYRILYKKGHYTSKSYHLICGVWRRLLDLFSSNRYDIVFIHREAFPIGNMIIERLFNKLNGNIIYDFDDSIFLPRGNNIFFKFIKRSTNIEKIIRLSRHVIAGNDYLKNYALQFNKNVTVIPTSIDTQVYKPPQNKTITDKVIIGWIGSRTTIKYLKILRGVFKKLLSTFKNIEMKIIGGEYKTQDPRITNQRWSLETELSDLQSFDIGIMPMYDNEWAKGKCAFKIIQYMAVGIPAIASSVGMNVEVIQNGVNGFLISSEEEWFEKLSILIENPELRQKLGKAGKNTVEQRYSLMVNAPKFIEVLKSVQE